MSISAIALRLPAGLVLLALLAGLFAGTGGAAAGQAPQANPDIFSIGSGASLNVAAPGVLKNDLDPDGGSVHVHDLVDGPDHGNLSLSSNGAFVYTSVAGFVGDDGFSYSIDDNEGLVSLPVFVLIHVSSGGPTGNVAPVANTDAYSGLKNQQIRIADKGVLANDKDANGDPLTASVVSKPSVGTLVLRPQGGFVYTPKPGFVGTVSFTYKAFDGAANSNVATVTLTIK
jgi:hypothetical protein